MANYHLKYNGEPAVCRAAERACPKGADVPHFKSMQEARNYYEQVQESNGGLLTLVSKKDQQKFLNKAKKSPQGSKPSASKFTKVAGGVLIALVAVNTISNISDSASASAPEFDGGVSNSADANVVLPEVEEVSEFNKVDETVDEVAGSAKVEGLVTAGKEKLSSGLNKANDWVSNSEVAQNGLSKTKDFIGGFTANFDDYDTNLTVQDDGSIRWGSKNLTPSAEEVANAKSLLAGLNVAPERELDYDREGMFGKQGDEIRGKIEQRDLTNATFNSRGRAVSGTLKDPYTGKTFNFNANDTRPYDLEHIVALKEIARSEDPNNPLTPAQREAIANDPNNLILVSSSENRSKSDKDVKNYLPSYKVSECRFVVETITVKSNYKLNVDSGEKDVLENVLNNRCDV